MSGRHRPSLAAACAVLTAFGTVLAAGPAAAAGPTTGAPAVLFVSPHGDDANAGTSPLRPVRTPERARDLVRTMNQRMAGDIVVLLLPGTYRLSRPLELDARDSGADGHRVVWTGLPLARPVISGAYRSPAGARPARQPRLVGAGAAGPGHPPTVRGRIGPAPRRVELTDAPSHGFTAGTVPNAES